MHRKDRMKKRADDDAKKRKDDDDAKRKDDDAKRADSINKLVDARIADRMPKVHTDDERIALAEIQSRADSVAQQFGKRATPPLLGETVRDYAQRMVRIYQAYSAKWKDVDLSGVTQLVFDNIAKEVYADAEIAARKPLDLKPGQLREIQKIDPVTGMRTTEFVGAAAFFGGLTRPARAVTRFNVRNGADA